MKTQLQTQKCRFMRKTSIRSLMGAVALVCLTITARAQQQQTFATPHQAVEALVRANEDSSEPELLAIFGADGKDIVSSADQVQDKASRESFVKAYKAKHALIADGADSMTLQVGVHNWPLPIPIVKTGDTWRFDTAAGKQELIYRRIGHNEIGAIDTCRGYIASQKDYAATGHDGLPAGLYAQKLVSDPGKQDGLYWETPEGAEPSPAGPFLANAGGQGYTAAGLGGQAQPYHGYLYRVLKAQGANAKGGAKSYLQNGNLSGGVALVAYPAQYKIGGVMTFIINTRGVVFQKDLGDNTADLAAAMTDYNPDSTWTRVKE